MTIAANVSLADKTTLGIGGPARAFAVVADLGELRDVVRAANARGDAILVLGGGSNVVVRDAGFDGVVVQLGWRDIAVDDDVVTAAAGAEWDDFVAEMVAAGRAGVECLAGIPGRVGATPMQNVGAYGQEVADTITRVRALDRITGEVHEFAPRACGFAYRTSAFKGTKRWIVVDVSFRLPRATESAPLAYAELQKALGADRAPLTRVRETVIALRRAKGMVVDAADPDSRSAGSFFTNPIVDPATGALIAERAGAQPPAWPQPDGRVKLSAAWLIERAGFTKGFVKTESRGAVGISTKHALALVNRGGATAAELLGLAAEISRAVRDKLGAELELEPVIV